MINLYKLNTLANKKNYPFYVIYFLCLNNDEIYIGITNKTVQKRVNKHIKGKGSIHTKNKKIKILKIIPTYLINMSNAAHLENRACKLTQKIIKNKKVWGGLFY
jgi:predicted GIY-YIG superfamily endonuclease